MKLKNSKIFWGSIPQIPLVASAFRTASWAGPGHEASRKCSVPTLCPGIGYVLATPLWQSAYQLWEPPQIREEKEGCRTGRKAEKEEREQKHLKVQMEKAKKSLERKHKQEEMTMKAIANATQKKAQHL